MNTRHPVSSRSTLSAFLVAIFTGLLAGCNAGDSDFNPNVPAFQPNIDSYCDGKDDYLATGQYETLRDDPFVQLCFLTEFTNEFGWDFWQRFLQDINNYSNDDIGYDGTNASVWLLPETALPGRRVKTSRLCSICGRCRSFNSCKVLDNDVEAIADTPGWLAWSFSNRQPYPLTNCSYSPTASAKSLSRSGIILDKQLAKVPEGGKVLYLTDWSKKLERQIAVTRNNSRQSIFSKSLATRLLTACHRISPAGC